MFLSFYLVLLIYIYVFFHTELYTSSNVFYVELVYQFVFVALFVLNYGTYKLDLNKRFN